MTISSFSGVFHFLSNFHHVAIAYEGKIYPSVENAYQAAKAHPSRREFYKHCTAGQAKRMGRKEDLPQDWGTQKVSVMRQLLADKFQAGSYLATLLIATNIRTLEEGNTWGDTFWGVCKGKGENHLGKLLMERRAFLAAL